MKERLLLRKKLRRSPYLNKRSAAKSTQGIFGTRADGACGAVTIQAPPNSAANDKDGRLNSILFVWVRAPLIKVLSHGTQLNWNSVLLATRGEGCPHGTSFTGRPGRLIRRLHLLDAFCSSDNIFLSSVWSLLPPLETRLSSLAILLSFS